jgi:hypothetical protein
VTIIEPASDAGQTEHRHGGAASEGGGHTRSDERFFSKFVLADAKAE